MSLIEYIASRLGKRVDDIHELRKKCHYRHKQIPKKDLKEAVFVFSCMYDALGRLEQLDVDRTDGLSKIELTNGSCIVIKLEEASK